MAKRVKRGGKGVGSASGANPGVNKTDAAPNESEAAAKQEAAPSETETAKASVADPVAQNGAETGAPEPSVNGSSASETSGAESKAATVEETAPAEQPVATSDPGTGPIIVPPPVGIVSAEPSADASQAMGAEPATAVADAGVEHTPSAVDSGADSGAPESVADLPLSGPIERPSEDVLSMLFEHLRSGECVVVVGASLSETMGAPSWKALVKGLIERVAREATDGPQASHTKDLARELGGLLDRGRVLMALSSIERHLGRARCEELVRDALSVVDAAGSSPALSAIAALPFRAAVTTAQAGPLGQAIAQAIARPLHEASREEAHSLDLKKRFLLWAFGKTDRPGSFILTSRDLRRAMAHDKGFRAAIEEIYRDRTLLLVGFRPDDPDLELLLTRLFPSLPPTEREHFLAIGGQTQVEAEDLLYEHQIRTIDIGGDIGADRGGESHAGLHAFLQELKNRCEREGVPLAAQAAARPARDDIDGWVAELLADSTDAEAQEQVARLERELREQTDWERLVELLLGKVEALTESSQRIAALREVARLFERELGEPSKALMATLAAVQEEPVSDELCGDAERLARSADLWSDLLAGYAELAGGIPASARGAYFARLGRWYAEGLHHDDYALTSYEAARKAEPTNRDALEALAPLYRKAGRFDDVAAVLEARIAAVGHDHPAVDLLLEVGDVFESNLKDTTRAAAAYRRALELDPNSTDALGALEAVLRRGDDRPELLRVLQQRVEGELDGVVQASLRREIGALFEAQKDLDAAVASYEAALSVDPRDVTALRALEHLYDALGKGEDYLRTLERLSDCAEDDKGRVALYRRMASEHEERPGGAARAIEWWERLLGLDPRSEDAFRALARLYRKEQRWDQLADCLTRHAAVCDGINRAELQAQAAQVFEREQDDPHRALEAWQAVVGTPGVDAERLRQARESLATLYERIEAYERAVDLHLELGEDVAGGRDADKSTALTHRVRAAELTRDRLGDLELAEARFTKALALDARYMPAMMALVDIYTRRGETLRAAKLRVEAEGATGDRLERTRLLYDAAVAYEDQLDSSEQAAELYDRLLALDPEHVEAGARLADLRLKAERWADAEPVLEMLVRKCDPDDRSRLARLARDLGRAAEHTRNPDRAMRAYRLAAENAPDELAPVAALAQLAYRQGDPEEAEKLYGRLVGDLRSALPESELVEAYHRLGVLARKRGALEDARSHFEQARKVDPGHRPTLEQLGELLHEKGEHQAVVETRRALLETASTDERANLLEEIGDLYRDKIGDKAAAISAYLEALEARPDSQSLLHALLELYSEEKQWRRAVDIVRRLVDMTREPAHRAKYYYAAAVICRDEIGEPAHEEALELMSLALDEDPETIKPFDAIERLLVERQDHRGLARAYRKMIKRLPATGRDDLRARLWQSMAEVCLQKLGERDSGIAALEVVASLKPGDAAREDELTRLYIEAGPTYAEKAIVGQQMLLRREPDRLAGYKTLRRLYVETRQVDKAWCLAGALRFLGAADSTDTAEWEAGRSAGFTAAKRRITEELWQKHIIHPREDRALVGLFNLLAPTLAPLTAQPLQNLGLKKSSAVDPQKDERMVVKLFRYATHTLGVQPPELFLRPDSKDPLQVANVADKAGLTPAMLVGAPHLDKKSEKELLFDLTKRLAFLRPERYLRYALPQATALAGAVASAFVSAGLPWSNGVPVDKADVEKLAAHLKRSLPQSALDQIAVLGRRAYQPERNKVADIKLWMDASDLTASRAAFVLTNDFEVAARLVASETGSGTSLSAKERLKELLVYSVSEDYFVVRKHLGFEVGAAR
jgi:tetratricopeptide (TPR) repeat protein